MFFSFYLLLLWSIRLFSIYTLCKRREEMLKLSSVNLLYGDTARVIRNPSFRTSSWIKAAQPWSYSCKLLYRFNSQNVYVFKVKFGCIQFTQCAITQNIFLKYKQIESRWGYAFSFSKKARKLLDSTFGSWKKGGKGFSEKGCTTVRIIQQVVFQQHLTAT